MSTDIYINIYAYPDSAQTQSLSEGLKSDLCLLILIQSETNTKLNRTF